MIHIVNAADGGYVPHTAAMLHSLFSANPGESFSVHFLHKGIDEGHLRRLADLCRRHGAMFEDTVVGRGLLAGLPIAGHFPEEAWYRVFLPQLLPAVDRALWLDSDTIVLSPIGPLWNLDLGDAPLAACPNAALYTFAGTIRGLGIEDRRHYFNSGVMLMNFRQMREERSEESLRAAATRYARVIRFADQDALNVVYHRRFRRLALAWNVLAHAHVNVPETIRIHGPDEYREAMMSPRIIHFTGLAAMKPWYYRCSHPQRAIYLHHRAAAGWPPPDFSDRSLKNSITRRIPLRLRTFLNAVARGQFGIARSLVRPW